MLHGVIRDHVDDFLRVAHLVDEVVPPVPVRQWVLTLPYRLRYLAAWDHGLSRAVLAVHAWTLLDFDRQRAQQQGMPAGRTGTVTAVQRFGGGLNLNVHGHTLALDGVFIRSPAGRLAFHAACGPSDAEVAQVLGAIRRPVGRLLRRRGLEPGADGGSSRQAREGVRGPCHTHLDGFDLHGKVWVGPDDRARLEQLCHYVLRPPLAENRLRRLADGRVRLALKRPWSDGTTYLLFEPVEFLEKLVALTPRPEMSLVL